MLIKFRQENVIIKKMLTLNSTNLNDYFAGKERDLGAFMKYYKKKYFMKFEFLTLTIEIRKRYTHLL